MTDYGKWHHGRSNGIECLVEECDLAEEIGGFTDAGAMKVARAHIAETGHTVTHSRTLYREIRPVQKGQVSR